MSQARSAEQRPQGAPSSRLARDRDFETSLPPEALTTANVPEVEQRSGRVARVTTSRVVLADCDDCEMSFTNTGAAASHARSSRHLVLCQYAAAFSYVPVERVAGGTPSDDAVPR